MHGPVLNAKPVIVGLVLVVLAGGAGCGHPVKRKLEGRWLGDSVENFDDEHVAAATGWVKGVSFEFSGSILTVAIPAKEPRSGTYEVAKVRESDVELAVQRPDKQTDRTRFILDDEHNIRWSLSDGRAVVLRRE
jgi:hypothetical protein